MAEELSNKYYKLSADIISGNDREIKRNLQSIDKVYDSMITELSKNAREEAEKEEREN